MNDKPLLGTAALLISLTYAYNSIRTVQATPSSGPTVSTGSNPILNIFQNCDNKSNHNFMTNSNPMDFVITDIVSVDGSTDIMLDGSELIRVRENVMVHLNTGLVVSSGEGLSCSDVGNSPKLTISGYYAQP